MDHISKLLGKALSTLEQPIATLPVSTESVDRYFSGFALVGNETPEEIATLQQMLAAAKAWCVAFSVGTVEPGWLSLCGRSGAGKTFLSRCIVAFLKDHARDAYNRFYRPLRDPGCENYLSCYSYAQEGTFLVKWPEAVKQAREGDYSLLKKAGSNFATIIDDVGAETRDKEGKPTPFAIGTLANLCDERLGKWTVLNSNLDRTLISTLYDTRIASRMMRNGGVIIDCKVRDFNLRREEKAKAA